MSFNSLNLLIKKGRAKRRGGCGSCALARQDLLWGSGAGRPMSAGLRCSTRSSSGMSSRRLPRSPLRTPGKACFGSFFRSALEIPDMAEMAAFSFAACGASFASCASSAASASLARELPSQNLSPWRSGAVEETIDPQVAPTADCPCRVGCV